MTAHRIRVVKENDIARSIKAAEKAGKVVRAATIDTRTGAITLNFLTGDLPETVEGDHIAAEISSWDAALDGKAH
ncbi:hypothetical protein [Asticcacaulis sp.]|uniref:hypothetical protein n=1 Tax=Asticcacaulis sp. TaxID=1872648 RepID=UPI003F7CA4CD